MNQTGEWRHHRTDPGQETTDKYPGDAEASTTEPVA